MKAELPPDLLIVLRRTMESLDQLGTLNPAQQESLRQLAAVLGWQAGLITLMFEKHDAHSPTDPCVLCDPLRELVGILGPPRC